MFYAPNSQFIEDRVPQTVTDRELVALYQNACGKLPYHSQVAFQELSGVPATADTNRAIADAIRTSYAKLSRIRKKQFLVLADKALDIFENINVSTNGKRKTA